AQGKKRRIYMMHHHQQNKPNSFCAVIMNGLNTHHLKIPTKFLNYLDKKLMRNAILIGPCGGKWQVSIIKRENGVYMDHGWSKFLQENLVKHEDFLVFTYDGNNNHFKVQIFCKNGCEAPKPKKSRPTTSCPQISPENERS
ncbi:hypothetical protein S245_042572, partial [Arachis hypogaea]